MPRSNITLYTEDGELVTQFTLGKAIRKAPFDLWSIIKCMSPQQMQAEDWPKGVEAEVAFLLVFHSHDVLRTTEIAKLLNRDVATICRALKSLEQKKWVLRVSRGTWQIFKSLVYHGRWGWVYRHERKRLNTVSGG